MKVPRLCQARGPNTVVLIGIHLVYHLHRAWLTQEGPSGSHLIENFLVVWMTNFVGTVATMKLPSHCGVNVDVWKTHGKAMRLHCDWCTIQCPDSQWWYLWQLCHPLPCLSLEFSVGGPIECPVTWTFTDCISLWCTSNDEFLTDTNVKFYYHQSASGRQELSTSVTKCLRRSDQRLFNRV